MLRSRSSTRSAAAMPQYVAVLATSRGFGGPGEQVRHSTVAGSAGGIDVDPGAVHRCAPSVQLFCGSRSQRQERLRHVRSQPRGGRRAVPAARRCRSRSNSPPPELRRCRRRTWWLGSIKHFKLLARGGSSASMERHRTLRNTIDWSYELLDDAESNGCRVSRCSRAAVISPPLRACSRATTSIRSTSPISSANSSTNRW